MSAVNEEEQLKNDQEEADPKVVLHCQHALQSTSADIVVRSPSGDTDIVVLMVSLIRDQMQKVFIDNGSGKNRTVIKIADIDISQQKKMAIIGFHAFTRCDYNSSFFRKGKEKCWKISSKYQRFEEAFELLGSSVSITNETFSTLEEFVCYLYGYINQRV